MSEVNVSFQPTFAIELKVHENSAMIAKIQSSQCATLWHYWKYLASSIASGSTSMVGKS